jgi:hypothetical protein
MVAACELIIREYVGRCARVRGRAFERAADHEGGTGSAEDEQIGSDEQIAEDEADYQALVQAFRAELDNRHAMGQCRTEER